MTHYRSKTLATWIAVVGGSIGLHRFYLRGFRDVLGWLYIPVSLVGFYGVQRLRALGLDDRLGSMLVPLLGITLTVSMFSAIVYGLTPDERWDARYNPAGPAHHMNWGTVLGVGCALVMGCGVLMATIAFTAQRYFEYRVGTSASQRAWAGATDAPSIPWRRNASATKPEAFASST